MKSFHYGPISQCGKSMRFIFVFSWPLIAFQWRERGYYIGWLPDELWDELKAAGRVGHKKPWRLW